MEAVEVEDELKKIGNDVEALKQSLPDATQQDHISKLQESVEHLTSITKSEPSRRAIVKVESQGAKKSSTSSRTKNFTIHEDEMLTKAWLAVREDIIVGTMQRPGTMWERILDAFNGLMGKVTSRTANGLQCRWTSINHAVNKFCGYLASLERTNQSGMSSADRINEAKRMYTSTEEQPFKFESCWLILKDTPKWNEFMLTKSAKRHKPNADVDTSGFGLNGSANVDTPLSLTPSTPISVPLEYDFDPSSPDRNRTTSPDERNAEKEKRENIGDDQTILIMRQLFAKFDERLQKQEELALRKIQLKEQRERMHQYKEDRKIMGKDLNGLNPMQLAFFTARQKEIWERWTREGRLPGAPNGSDFGASSAGEFTNGGM